MRCGRSVHARTSQSCGWPMPRQGHVDALRGSAPTTRAHALDGVLLAPQQMLRPPGPMRCSLGARAGGGGVPRGRGRRGCLGGNCRLGLGSCRDLGTALGASQGTCTRARHNYVQDTCESVGELKRGGGMGCTGLVSGSAVAACNTPGSCPARSHTRAASSCHAGGEHHGNWHQDLPGDRRSSRAMISRDRALASFIMVRACGRPKKLARVG